jgi:arylsulfatase A-like enzyme
MDIAGAPKPATLDGYSLAPFWNGQPSDHPDFIASEYHSNMGNTGSFMLRQGDYKYITYSPYFPGPAAPSPYTNYTSRLYDIKNDPFELDDIYNASSKGLKRCFPSRARTT